MEIYPCFSEEYTLRKKVTEDKNEMNNRMEDRFGYII